MPAMCEANDEMYAKDPSAVTASPLYRRQEDSCEGYSGEAVTADGSFAYISSFGSHMAGISTPKWSVMDSPNSQFYWVKSAQGYPWDVKKYDANLIYDWVTEVSWTDPKNFKKHLRSN